MTSINEHPSVQRVEQALRAAEVTTPVTILDDSARTAADAAAALTALTGATVEVGQIANSLVFDADGDPLLVLASGAAKVDVTLIAAAVGATRVRRADPELVRSATGFVIGGVSPVGHLQPLQTLIDLDLESYAQVWAAAGHPHAVFATTYDELRRLTGAAPTRVR
ncbi:MAG: YbaK/EbsC family protein [Actinomycetes bacterium]